MHLNPQLRDALACSKQAPYSPLHCHLITADMHNNINAMLMPSLLLLLLLLLLTC
jgi:hypothetical protein